MPAVPLLADRELPIPPRAGAILSAGARSGRLTHLEHVPAAEGRRVGWPDWAPLEVTKALEGAGVFGPWAHQAAAAGHAAAGRNVIISTSPASGKSLGYLLSALTRVLDGGTALYLAPTRALAADQLRMVASLGIPGVRPAVVDGDTPFAERDWARAHASYLLTTPDMLHHSLLPRHARWDGFFRRLAFVIVDECHTYRGVFGSHVAQVLRRLRRVAAHHGSRTLRPPPVFVLASATISEPETCARLLTGLDAVAVTADSAPRGPLTFALWEPPLTALRGEAGAPVRRTATTEAAGLLADLVGGGVPALAFVRSRRGAETVAMVARRNLTEAGAADLADQVAAYLVHHPEALLNRPVEATVLDPGNPYVLAPHLCAAAAELPLTEADIALFGPAAAAVADDLSRQGMLRPRKGAGGTIWCWTRNGRAHQAGLRGTGGAAVRIVEESTGRLVGTVDEPSAHVLAHAGAVYPHQGEMYLVTKLDLDDCVALVEAGDPGYATSARELTRVEVAATVRQAAWGEAEVGFGDVLVTRQVVSFAKRRLDTGQPFGVEALDLPPRTLRTRAVWWTISPEQRAGLASAGVDLPGAAHAAEHASIGLLPLVAACDRWDVGGVSADLHPATGRLTVFVYDEHDGGAGFAERGFRAARDWLRATAQAIASCECAAGCPSCIQSPKCGNGNEPLSKPGAVTLLECLLC